MLERVTKFADAYPESRFLASFAEPVREFQASHIDEYFTAGDGYRALSFFEKNRKLLFPKVTPELATRLFTTYVDVHRSEAAASTALMSRGLENDGDGLSVSAPGLVM